MVMFIHIQFGEVLSVQYLLQEELLELLKRHKKKAHVLHITTKQEIDFLSQHKGNITFEITPQHLTIYAPDCYDKLGTYAQMNPPLRDKSHYDRLWYAVRNNLNDTIGSDHAPHLKVNKDKEYPNSPSGMPGVQTLNAGNAKSCK